MKKYKKENEMVLVFKTSILNELGDFQGINTDYEKYISKIINSKAYFFMPRREAEENPQYKQLIPYVIISCEDKILYYIRGKKTGEKRLNSLGSIGIGGHINYYDFSLFKSDIEAYLSAVRREVDEEIEVKSDYKSKIIGVLNDDSNPVGKVHFGVIHLWKLKNPVVGKKEKEITKISFKTPSEIKKESAELESWSEICIDYFYCINGKNNKLFP